MSRRAPLALLLTVLGAGCAHRADRPEIAPSNVALGKAVWVIGGAGYPATVTDGRLVTEGTVSAPAAVALRDVRSEVTVDLGSVQPVAALLLQAGTADVYFVETSIDGAVWRVAWRVPPLHGPAVLRTWTTTLPRPVPARWLRVRPTTAVSAAVSEVQAFPTEPPAWPRFDMSHPDSSLPLWPNLTRSRLAAVYAALAALLMMTVGWSVLARRSAPGAGEERVRRAALVALALASLVAWPNLLNFHYSGFVHKWEFFHYYMGGKYLPELGYTRLYACTAVIDDEDGIDLRGHLMRDLRDNRRVPAESQLERAAECRARFSPKRWEAFRHDARFFRAALGGDGWMAVRNDHGFNGSPAWALLAGSFARLAPISWAQVGGLAALDVALLLMIFALIGRTFGLEAACIGAGYWGLNTFSQWGWIGGGFLRHDWVFWLVAGVAALRVRRPAVAGFALAYSSALRVFPVVAIAGLVLKALAEVVEHRSFRPLQRHSRFAAGVATAAVLLLAGSSLMAGRTGIWKEFADNSAKHLGSEAVNVTGLQSFLTYEDDARVELMTDPLLLDRHAAWKEHLAAATRAMRPALWAAGAAFLVLLALAARGVPDWAAAVLGFGLVPILMKVSDYYYAGFVVFAALWLLSAGAGLALAGLTWVTTVIPGLWTRSDAQHAWLSLAAVVFVVVVTGIFAWRPRPASVPGTRPEPEGRGEPPTA